jgi:PBP1b-binding outer membrane lipoprotein LpoB
MKAKQLIALVPVALIAVGCSAHKEEQAPAIDGQAFWTAVCTDQIAYEDMSQDQREFFNTTRASDFGVEECMTKSYK